MTELVFILDRSGSMAGLETDTIGGFNSMLAQQNRLQQQQLWKQPQQQLQKAAQRAKLMRKQKQPAGVWML